MPSDLRGGPEWFLLSGMASWRLGDFTTSRYQALAAQARYRARGDADGEMRALNVAAAGAFALGALDEAEEGFHRALDLARELGDELMVARCSNNLGNICLYLGRHDAAHGFYRVARAGFERLGFEHGAAETWINTAITWRDLDRHDEALRAADRALEIAERAGARRLLAEALANRGAALAALGDRALGRAQIERGVELARTEGDRLAEADALAMLATLATASGAHDDAERLGREALAIAEEVHHLWTIAEIQRQRARHYRAAGRATDAAAAYSAAEQAFRALGSIPRAEMVANERSGG
jgi:tetratricopeptide (TPR) repeat protein